MSLQEMYEEKTTDFMQTFMEYVNTVRVSAEAGPDLGKHSLTINLDSAGFPLAPNLPSWDEKTKEELERLYRAYITQHYSKLIHCLPVF